MDRKKMRSRRSKKIQELLVACAEFEDIVRWGWTNNHPILKDDVDSDDEADIITIKIIVTTKIINFNTYDYLYVYGRA